MASAALSTGEPRVAPPEMESREQFIRVIVADSQAIFRAGLRKIFAVEDDIRVVGQAETLEQAISAAKKFSAEILIFEAALAANPVEAAQEILKQAPGLRLAVVTETPNEELTLDLFRRGAHAIVSREIDSEMFVECLRTIAKGEPWLEKHAVKWMLDAYPALSLAAFRWFTKSDGLRNQAISRFDRWSLSAMGINEMVRHRVGLRPGSLHQEDHRNAHRIHRHPSGQDHLSPGCIRRTQQGSGAEEVFTGTVVGLYREPAFFAHRP
jgi:hypothetical protein